MPVNYQNVPALIPHPRPLPQEGGERKNRFEVIL